MTDPSPGPAGAGRRIDRVLATDFLAGLDAMPLGEVRARRREAEQEEAGLSYVRRLLQGRLDILRAELNRRAGGTGEDEVTSEAASPEGAGGGGLVSRLSSILADRPGPASLGRGRFVAVQPSGLDARHRDVEQVVADAGLSDVPARTDDELSAGLGRLEVLERAISADRRRVQQVMDACTAEIGRRYREGAANVEDLLPEH